jgi:hypothetical protein
MAYGFSQLPNKEKRMQHVTNLDIDDSIEVVNLVEHEDACKSIKDIELKSPVSSNG